MSVKEEVDGILSANTLVMFSKSSCPYCKGLKEALDGIGVKYSAIETDIEPNGSEIKSDVVARSGCKTVPQVFLKGEFIGDSSKVKGEISSGELQPKLKDAGLL